jgi:hypothetical protein
MRVKSMMLDGRWWRSIPNAISLARLGACLLMLAMVFPA